VTPPGLCGSEAGRETGVLDCGFAFGSLTGGSRLFSGLSGSFPCPFLLFLWAVYFFD
jgi:hypothetical protein